MISNNFLPEENKNKYNEIDLVFRSSYHKNYPHPITSYKTNFKLDDTMLDSSCYWTTGTTNSGRVSSQIGTSLPELKEGMILDLGCSIGLTTEEISQLYPHCFVVGLDISLARIKKAVSRNSSKAKKNIAFLVADGCSSPFPPGTFEAVFAMNNLANAFVHTNYSSLIQEQLGKVISLVSMGGYLVLSGAGVLVLKREKLGLKIQGPPTYLQEYSPVIRLVKPFLSPSILESKVA